MFSKIKVKKPPLSLSNVSNAIKLLGSHEVPLPDIKFPDLDLFIEPPVGFSGAVVAAAHEPVQKLLAVATSNGNIHVLGMGATEVAFEFSLKSQWIDVRFVRGVYLVAVSTGGLTVISLYSKQILHQYSPGGIVTCVALDPSCDFVVVGLQNGAILFYDVDRLSATPMRLDNLQKKTFPKEKLLPLEYVEYHPRSPGVILTTYNQCAVLFNLATGEIVDYHRQSEQKKLLFKSSPPLMPVLKAHFHPNGLHVGVLFADSLFLIFDTQLGDLITTRSFEDCDATDFRWLTMKDPEYTQIAIAGSILAILDLGLTLKYSITLVEKQAEFYHAPPLRTLILSSVNKIIPLCSNPYFNGCGDALWVLALNDGRLEAVSLISKDSELLLPQSLLLICPQATFTSIETVKRVDWYSVATSQYGSSVPEKFFNGGKASPPGVRPVGHDDAIRNLLISGHQTGFIRVVELNNPDGGDQQILIQLEGDLRLPVLEVSSAMAAKVIVAAIPGSLVICKYGKPARNNTSQRLHSNGDATIMTVPSLGSSAKSSKFFPHSVISIEEEISCIKVSDTGFAAVAYTSGRLIVIDVARGPGLILNEKLAHFVPAVADAYATTIEFLIQEYGSEGFSSIIMLLGGNGGLMANFKIVPQPNGAFMCEFADKMIGLTTRDATIIRKIIPVSLKGDLAIGTLDIFHRLATGVNIPSYMITSSDRDLRVLKLPKQKLAHKVYDENIITCGLIQFRQGAVLGVVLELGTVLLLLLPLLTDVATMRNKKKKESKNAAPELPLEGSHLSLLITGEVFIAKSITEFTSKVVFAKGVRNPEHLTDTLFNQNVIYPLKPQTGAAQWLKGGLTFITSEDLAHLIAGPNRKPAKHPESIMAYNISPEANPNQLYGTSTTNSSEEAYKQPVRKAGKGAGYGLAGNNFMKSIYNGLNQAEESFNGYANQVSESVNEGMKLTSSSFYLAALKHKAGF